MIKNTFLSLLVLTGLFLIAQPAQAEAKHHHCRSCSSSKVGLNVNVGTRAADTYVTRRYVQQPVVVPTTVLMPQGYYAPVYAYQVVQAAPVYYEEVYVAPAPRRVGFGGLSFSWNFFN